MFSGNEYNKLINRYKLHYTYHHCHLRFQCLHHNNSSVQGKLFLLQEHLCVEQFVRHWHLANSMMALKNLGSEWQQLTICVHVIVVGQEVVAA